MNRMDMMGYVATPKGRRTNLTGLLSILMVSKDKETKTVIGNYIAKATGRSGGGGVDRGFGHRMGTPPRKKTVHRLEVQGARDLTTLGVRIMKYDPKKEKWYATGHPTKRHTAGRVEAVA